MTPPTDQATDAQVGVEPFSDADIAKYWPDMDSPDGRIEIRRQFTELMRDHQTRAHPPVAPSVANVEAVAKALWNDSHSYYPWSELSGKLQSVREDWLRRARIAIAALSSAPEFAPQMDGDKALRDAEDRLAAVRDGAGLDQVYGIEWCFDRAAQFRADLASVLSTPSNEPANAASDEVIAKIDALREVLDDAEDALVEDFMRSDSAMRARCTVCKAEAFCRESIEHKTHCFVGNIRTTLGSHP